MRAVVAVASMLAAGCLSFEPVGEDPGAADVDPLVGDGASGDVDVGDLDSDPGDASAADPTGDGDPAGADPTGPCDGGANGTVCAIGLCRDGACVAGMCFIDARWFSDGERNPSSICQQCSATTDPLAWSNTTGSCDDGNPCTANDTCSGSTCNGALYSCPPPGLPCQVAVCNGLGGCDYVVEAGACLIDGQCLADGDPHPTQTCRECDPAQSARAWSVSPDETPCTDSGQCRSGTCCIGGCWDGNGCRSGYDADACGSGGGECDDCTAVHECDGCPGAAFCTGGLACAFPRVCDPGVRVCARNVVADPQCCMGFCSPVDCY